MEAHVMALALNAIGCAEKSGYEVQEGRLDPRGKVLRVCFKPLYKKELKTTSFLTFFSGDFKSTYK